MKDYDYSSEIIKTEQFQLLRHLQHCSSNVVHENDQVLLNGTFYNYCDNSVEMKEYREQQKNKFVQSIISVINDRYPNLSTELIKQIAVRCSDHSLDNKADRLLDIDICALQYFEENRLNDQLNECLENINDSSSKTRIDSFDIETYSEEYAKYFVLSQLSKHIKNNSEPLLTWGEARLVAEINANFVKKNNVSKTF